MEELRAIGVPVEQDDAGEQVGAVVLGKLGRLPRKGDSVSLGGPATAEITKVSRRRVTHVRVRLKAEAAPE
jgi:CBS domain containing-hemolysin-like protein